MAIKRRKNKLQDLAASGIVTNRISGSIPFEYEGPNSPLFTVSEIPQSVPQGKSSFLIAGTELLKNSVEVKIEIIDSEGGVIYTEPVANYLEGNARRVSIEVYDDTPPGPANLYILAQVDPEEWEDETGTDVTNYPNPQPLRPKGKKRKKRRKRREKRKQQQGQPRFDMFVRGGAGAFFVNPNFRPPPGNDTRFRRRRSRRRRRTTDISDQYNFIQKIQMQIVPTATNTEKILFYQEPRLRVFEAFKPSVSNIAPSASLTETGFGITGTVIQDTAGSAAASSLDTFGAAINTFRKKRKFRKFAMKGGLSKRKRITRRASPEVDNYSLNVGTNFNFTSEHVGADLKLTNISVDQNQFPSSRFKADSLGTELNKATASFEVRKVKNSFTIIPDKPFQLFDSQISQVVDAPLTNASFSIEFPNPVTQSISITNFRSYADVRVSNIRTFSGDVFRAKVYRKSEESISDYELFADLPLESSELLLNKNEGTGLERTGYFVTQSDAVDYWEVSSSHTGLTGNAATASAKYDIDKIMDAIYISGSNYEKNDFVHFKLKKEYSFILEKDVDYDFSGEIYGVAKPKIVQPEEGPAVTKSIAEMEVFISGSNIPAQQGNEPFGAKIGALRIIDGSVEKDFGIVTGDFESTATSANCVISFKVNAGQFYLSDLSLRPATETGFSPDLFTFQAPMPDNETRPETYEFLAEFYDVNNNQADAFAFTPSGSIFQGSNMVIGGGDNVMESNLFIGGETTASGMHLGGVKSTVPEQGGVAGAEGSAFMRSVGYTGFTSASVAGKGGKPGFMFYSGSILPSSGDNYKGVGLELVGESGSLRFGTNPSRFEVKADAFFVGRRHEDSSTGMGQFISGALGNVEISSSNFHLTRAGNVTMAGTITATAGAIGGFGINANSISSSNNNLILRSTGEITGSNVLFDGGKIASFEISDSVLKNDKNFFISGAATGNQFFISSSNFNVKASGDITGSQVLFEGGTIGGLTIAGDNLSAGNSYKISSSQDVNDDVSFISSSEFKVSADGRITGSQVKFDGGTIAGWSINSDNLQGGSLILSKDGSMRSSNYVSDFSGWIISAEDNGFAEFENVKVRGTLATTTFEKESVNAVGGQLFVANSTTITGSAVGASDTTMSVENMSGFAEGEVLISKKVTNTGFTTEYIKVNSASFDGDVSKDEFYGRIMVDRAIGQSPPPGTDSGSVGDPPGAGVAYEPGQVLASTGKIGTGYIRINANPNNQATPYIDIVERTGSGPYDVELKARLGDLSGTAGTRNVPLGFTGFGLMSEVAFLSGSQIKLEAPAFILGDQNKTFVSGSEGNIEISSSAFHLKRDGQLLFGDKANNKYIEWDNSNLIVRGDLSVDNIRTPSTIEGAPTTFANASSSINSDGGAFFKSGSIAGFEFTPAAINSADKSLVMSASGQITGSNVKFTGGTIADFTIDGSKLKQGTSFHLDGDSSADYFISSSNFHVTPAGNVTADNAIFSGTTQVKNVSVADYFAYNNIVITTSNDHLYLETFTAQQYAGGYSTKTFWKLVLDGSLGGESGHVVTLDNLDAMVEYPIACIVPPSQNNNANTTGTPPSSGFGAGHRIVIEVKNMDMYFTRNNSYHSNIDASSDVPTGYHIAADVDDMYSFGFSRTYTVSSTSYNNTLKVATGTRLEFLRGAADFKVQSISSLTGIGISSPGPTATFNTANSYLQSDGRSVAPFIIAGTPFLGGSGQGLGTLFLTSNKVVHADQSLYYGSTTRSSPNSAVGGTTNATCSLGMQSGTGNVFHNAVGQYKPTYIYEGGSSTDAMMLGAAGGTDSNGNPNWPDTEFPLILRPNIVAFNAEFEHNYSQDFQQLRDFRIASGRDVRIKSNHNGGTQFGRYTFHVDADLGGVSVNRRFENSYTGRSFQAHHSSSAAELSGDYVALFQHDGNYASAHGITIQAGDDTNTGATTYIHFRDGDGGSIGAISSTGGNISYGTFTGVHEAYAVDSNGVINCAEDSLSGSIWPIGTVCSYVSSSLEYDKNGNISPQPINYVATSSAYKDKRLYGVYFTGIAEEPRSGSFVYTNLYRPTGSSEGILPETKYGSMQQLNRDLFNVSSSRLEIPTGYVKKNTFDEFSNSHPDYIYVSQSIVYEGDVEDRRQNLHNIAALGDAIIRVNNQGGNIEIGDYLTSSNTGGVACKQDDDLLHNYTLAKSTQNVNFSEITGSEVTIACTLHAG